VAVEPNEWNCDEFRKDMPDNTTLIQAAIGTGEKVYHVNNNSNSGGQCYLSAGLGYPKSEMEASLKTGALDAPNIPSIKVSDLKKYVQDGDKIVMKIDIEGAENSIFSDVKSVEFLKEVDYITAELHFYAMTSEQVEEVTKVTESALKELEQSHTCKRYGIFFHATKK
jgi:FkbM family methyltransferase